MNEKSKKITRKEKVKNSVEEFEGEGEKITSAMLAEEILPLMQEYFVGKFVSIENMVLCAFRNNQRFRITIEKCE